MTKPLVLIFGESSNDTHAIEHLLRALLPENFQFDTRKLKSPQILSRNASRKKRLSDAELVAKAQEKEVKAGSKVVVVAHRDCDEIEPSHVSNSDSLRLDLLSVGVCNPIAATPAWCIETWWMQFADEVAKVRTCWSKIDFSSRSIGQIENAKTELQRALRPKDKFKNCPDYRESDGITIALHIRRSGVARLPSKLLSNSLADFRSQLYKVFSLSEILK